MKIVITSGPMTLNIDAVRKIENTSSGTLGALFATVAEDFATEIVYIHTKNAKVPTGNNIRLIEIENHQQLLTELENELPSANYCIHAMAISDFQTTGVIEIDKLADALSGHNKIITETELRKILENTTEYPEKLNSKKHQLIMLTPAMKIVDEIKRINPKIKLVSFKLLANVSEQELIQVALKQLTRTNSTLVVANMMDKVENINHEAIIIDQTKKIKKVKTKQEIVVEVFNQLKEKNEKYSIDC